MKLKRVKQDAHAGETWLSFTPFRTYDQRKKSKGVKPFLFVLLVYIRPVVEALRILRALGAELDFQKQEGFEQLLVLGADLAVADPTNAALVLILLC
jgi:hypothetical protein